MFNERSCVACHSLGGVGGAGPNNKNVDLLSPLVPESLQFSSSNSQKPFANGVTARSANGQELNELRSSAMKIHFDLLRGGIVLHSYSTDLRYAAFRDDVLGLIPKVAPRGTGRFGELPQLREPPGDAPIKTVRIDGLTLELSRRNSTAMFGAGLIDRITDAQLKKIAELQTRRNPQLTGRVLGRFGWRGQTTRLDSFVRTACAVELGLGIKGVPNPTDSPIDRTLQMQGKNSKRMPDNRPKLEDLTEAQVKDLVAFVAALPAPIRRLPTDEPSLTAVQRGDRLFSSVGCAECHLSRIGDVDGFYSDLLVHDMGAKLYDPQGAPLRARSHEYYGSQLFGEYIAERTQEWRTPPLWGLADSGPYLHDGRAATVDEAILWHDGEATASTMAYRVLPPRDRGDLLAFLSTLAAPPGLEPSPPQPDSVTEAKSSAIRDEKAAAARLRLAVAARDRKEFEIARQWLAALQKDFPNTTAAAEAAQLPPSR